MPPQIIENFPYTISFFFNDLVQNTQFSVLQPVPYNLAIYGLSIGTSRNITTSFYAYNIQILNYYTGEKLMDENVQNLNVQSDCRLPFRFPSMWFIEKNQKLVCKLNMLDDSATTDIWVNLLSYTTKVHPNPGRAPFIYGFPRTVGFQDNSSGVTTSVPFGMTPTGSIAKPAIHDFELSALTLDVSGDAGLSAFPNFAFQFSVDRGKRRLFSRPVLNGLAGGGVLYQQGVPGTGATISGVPNNQVVQWKLPKPLRINRGDLMRFDVYPSPTYVTAVNIPLVLNQQCCLAAIGSHIYE